MPYGYDDLERDLADVSGVFIFGKSLFGRNLYAVVVGEGAPRALIHGGIHARESVSSAVVVKMLKNYEGRAVCFVPMLNPDGAMLVKYGVQSAPENARKALLKINGYENFGLWKANGRAVDLNVNFDAGWSTGASNVNYPAAGNYVGEFPQSEPEVRAIVSLTEKYAFTASVSLHTKGELIYYGFEDCKSYKEYGRILSLDTGYPLSESAGSAGGYKDWFLLRSFGAGYTVELGDDGLSHPIGAEYADEIYDRVKNLAALTAEIGEDIWNKNLCCAQ